MTEPLSLQLVERLHDFIQAMLPQLGDAHPLSHLQITFPQAWQRAPKPLKPENTRKKLTKKATRSPLPSLGPKNTKELPKKIQKLSFLGHFCVVVIFFIFLGPTLGGGFCIFFSSCIFVFGFQGFRGSLPGPWDRNLQRRLHHMAGGLHGQGGSVCMDRGVQHWFAESATICLEEPQQPLQRLRGLLSLPSFCTL